MEFRILGPLEVVENGRRLDLGGPKQRALLAALLLRRERGRVAGRAHRRPLGREPAHDRGEDAAGVRLASPEGACGDADGRRRTAGLETHGHGYVLRIDPGRAGRRSYSSAGSKRDGRRLARDDPKLAADRLRDALALWRGPALADLAYESFAQPEIARLEELRLTALEERIDSRPRARSGRRADRRARGARRAPSAPRAPPRSAHARAVPRGSPGAGAAGVPGRPAASRRRARARAERVAPASRAPDPRAGPRARCVVAADAPGDRAGVRVAPPGAHRRRRRSRARGRGRGRGVAARRRGRRARDGRRDRAGPGNRRTARDDLLRHGAVERRRGGGQRLGPRRRRQDGDPDRPRDERRPARLQHGVTTDRHRRRGGGGLGRQRAEPRAERLSRERVPDRPRVRGRRRHRRPAAGGRGPSHRHRRLQPAEARGDAGGGLGHQSRPDGLADRPANEPRRRAGRRERAVDRGG